MSKYTEINEVEIYEISGDYQVSGVGCKLKAVHFPLWL